LVSTFFGLISDNSSLVRAALFTQIHQIVFHSNGGYDWHTVYNMPIWLRRFTFKQMQDHFANEKAAIENNGKSGKQTVINSDGTIKTPELMQKANESRRPVKYQ
jgi:hypothetical protein